MVEPFDRRTGWKQLVEHQLAFFKNVKVSDKSSATLKRNGDPFTTFAGNEEFPALAGLFVMIFS